MAWTEDDDTRKMMAPLEHQRPRHRQLSPMQPLAGAGEYTPRSHGAGVRAPRVLGVVLIGILYMYSLDHSRWRLQCAICVQLLCTIYQAAVIQVMIQQDTGRGSALGNDCHRNAAMHVENELGKHVEVTRNMFANGLLS